MKTGQEFPPINYNRLAIDEIVRNGREQNLASHQTAINLNKAGFTTRSGKPWTAANVSTHAVKTLGLGRRVLRGSLRPGREQMELVVPNKKRDLPMEAMRAVMKSKLHEDIKNFLIKCVAKEL